MKFKALLLFALLPTFSFAAKLDKELSSYTEIQSLLAKDTFAGVPAASQKLATDAKENHHAALSASSAKLANAKDLKQARELFMGVSKDFVPLAKTEKNKNFEIVYCPMKKARWVQKTGTIANPYYGSEMLECGVKE